MTFAQTITPNPDIPCTPGWCLQYVRETYSLPARYSSATEAWANSASQHTDRDFPADCWVPVWFSLATEPAGHVALLAPDGSVYSSSDANTSIPHHHPSLDNLISYYAAGNPLTYLGWTEDVAGYPVITWSSIDYESATITPQSPTITPKEWYEMALDQQTKLDINEAVWGGPGIPLILNNELGHGEYASTLLGAMTDRVVRQQIVPLRQEVAAQAAQVASLIGALANVSKGESFDEAKLLAGVQAAAEAGVKSAIESIDTTITVKAAA